MPCAYPMYRLDYERASRLVSFPVSFEKRVHNKGVILNKDEALYFKGLSPLLKNYIVQVPCGKCIACRLSYSREWANRCMAELKYNPDAVFLTLTYDDDHLSFAPYFDPDVGSVDIRPTLVPKDLQDFLKRLRIKCQRDGISQEIRFFACGEYGDDSGRPHYHLILFGLRLPERGKHLWRSPAPDTPALWTHTLFKELWPHGLSCYGDVNWETCAYTARYVLKKRKGFDRTAQLEGQATLGLPPWQEEFVRMSRRPGLGREYYDRSKTTIYTTDEMFLPIGGSISTVRPCKYYDRLYDLEEPDQMSILKKKRARAAESSLRSVLQRTDKTEEEYLEQLAAAKLDQSRRLVRPSI